MTLTDNLSALLGELTDRGSPVARHLLPGLAPGEVAARTQALPVEVHPSVVELFGWRNGVNLNAFTPPTAAPTLVPDLDFLPLAAACSVYRSQMAMREEGLRMELPDDGLWPPSWFPVFCFSEHAAVERSTGAVFAWMAPWHGANERLFESLEDCVAAVRYLIGSGEATIDTGGRMQLRGRP